MSNHLRIERITVEQKTNNDLNYAHALIFRNNKCSYNENIEYIFDSLKHKQKHQCFFR